MFDVRLLCRLVPATLLTVLPACSLAKGPGLNDVAPEINATRTGATSVITPGDTLRIQFRQKPEYNQETPVLPDGTVSLLELGTSRVAGLTIGQLTEILAEQYRPTVSVAPTVSITDPAPRTAVVLGEVEEPGEVTLGPDQRLTLLEAIAQTGGFSKRSAWLSNTLLVRWDATEQQQRTWVIDARPRHWEGPEPIYLQQYDVVFIPNTNVDEVGIWVDNYIRRMLPLPFVPTF